MLGSHTVTTAARRTRSADVRGALVDAAVAVLERDGTAGLTVRAVAREAGVAPMGVYNHLDGKDGLLDAVLERGFLGLRAAVTPPATVTGAPERLLESGRGYRRFALANPVTYGLMFGSETMDADPDSAGAGAFGALVDLVAEGQRAGIVESGEPTGLAMQVWSCVHGALALELAGCAIITDPAANYERVLDLILRGLAPVT